jgi:transketolase
MKIPEKKSIRDGFGEGLVEAGEQNDKIVVFSADVSESVRANLFKEKFPERFIEVGVAEQNMAVIASGLANYGRIPFITSYAVFSPGRNWEQIRTTIAINNLPVKIIGGHAGVTVGPDGITHQALEDIALMRVLPNMVVVVPCDALEARKATLAIAQNGKPSYMRTERPETPIITTEDSPFEIGKANILRNIENTRPSEAPEERRKATIVACGSLVFEALAAAEELSKEGVECEVINCHTIKPLDEKTIIESAQKTGAIVTVEDHQLAGGLGSAVAECLAQNHPTPQEFVAVRDRFGQSGTPEELLKEYRLDKDSVMAAVKKVLGRK